MAAFSSCGFILVLSVSILLLSQPLNSEPTQDKQALLAFLSQTHHENGIHWSSTDSACNWIGVVCDPTRSFVSSLRLPAAGLSGPISANTLGRLRRLRVLCLRDNRLSGQILPDFANLTVLRSLFLQGNTFSGEFPALLTRLGRLVRLDISSNNFTAAIPPAVNNLTSLTGLFLQNNGFTGSIPSINLARLTELNVSNNVLAGPIPATLASFPASSFAGNNGLCGRPLLPC